MNKYKKAYTKYLNSFSRYLEIASSKRQIVIKTSIDNFPHLVGKNYLKKYKKLSTKKFIEDLSNGIIDNDTIYKIPNKNERNIVLNKLKAIEKMDSFKKGKIIYKNIQLSANLFGNAFILVQIGTSKSYAIIVLKRDRTNLYHPMSIMLLNQKERKIQKLNAEASEDIKDITKKKKR